jgi:hypothetical protein
LNGLSETNTIGYIRGKLHIGAFALPPTMQDKL